MTHRIRLHGPWGVTPTGPDAPAGRMTIPGTLRDGGWERFAGQVTFLRRFGRPTNLDADERVWLVFEQITGPARAWLHQNLLGTIDGTARFDVTALLAERNDLQVEIDAVDDQCGIVGDVLLEIKASGAA